MVRFVLFYFVVKCSIYCGKPGMAIFDALGRWNFPMQRRHWIYGGRLWILLLDADDGTSNGSTLHANRSCPVHTMPPGGREKQPVARDTWRKMFPGPVYPIFLPDPLEDSEN